MSIWKNRVQGLEFHKAQDLDEHAGNWRSHPENQVNVVVGTLEEVGISDRLLAYRSPRNGGRLTVIDGHLRRDLDPSVEWPVLILDVTDAEADYLLATLDPSAELAIADVGALDALLATVDSGVDAVKQMLADLAKDSGIFSPEYDPIIGFGAVTDEDVAKADEKLGSMFDSRGAGQIPVICPHCGTEFWINRSDIPEDE